jgi:hypothetical protein
MSSGQYFAPPASPCLILFICLVLPVPGQPKLLLWVISRVASALPAAAADYPRQPVRVLVGLAAGGGTDIVARLLAEWLSENLGQQFIVENRTGMGGSLAAQALINAPPDGYTLLFMGPNKRPRSTRNCRSTSCAIPSRWPA